MTLYYSLVFLLLVVEIVIFFCLLVPLPSAWRRKLFTFVSQNPIIAKLQYGMKITFIFIFILFVDSINRVYRVQLESAAAHKNPNIESAGGPVRLEVQVRKFYAQRNMYLCGFTLFLSVILNRTYAMILDILRLEEEIKRLNATTTASKSVDSGDAGEVGKLRKELAAKERDLDNLKKQAGSFQREYNRLGDEKVSADGTPKKDK